VASHAGATEKIWFPKPVPSISEVEKVYASIKDWGPFELLESTVYKDKDGMPRIDVWVQDAFECGYSQSATTGMICILDTNTSDRGWGQKKATGSNFGYIKPFSGELGELEQGGNIEVSPPTTKHPHGCLVVGKYGENGPSMADEMKSFFRIQNVQLAKNEDGTYEFCEVDVSYLAKSHLDEVLSFTADKILIAAPHKATECWERAAGVHAQYMAKTINTICDERNLDPDGIPPEILNSTLAQYNNNLWNDISSAVEGIEDQLGMEDTDRMLIPTLFFPWKGGANDARTGKARSCPFPNRVNLIYSGGTFIFGDIEADDPVAGADPIKADLVGKVGSQNAKFVISDVLYDRAGDVHCASQAARRSPTPGLVYGH